MSFVERVPWLRVTAPEPEATAGFLENAIGLTRLPSEDGAAVFDLPGTRLRIVRGPAVSPAVLSFAIGDPAGFHERAAANGAVAIGDAVRGPEGRAVWYREPGGLEFVAIETPPDPVREGIVLSGGGALAAFEVGVLASLARRCEPRVFCGTSAGAYNAAVLGANFHAGFDAAVRELDSIWRHRIAGPMHHTGVMRLRGDPSAAFDLAYLTKDPVRPFLNWALDGAFLAARSAARWTHFASASEPLARRMLELIDIGQWISAEPMKQLVSETIDVARLLSSPVAIKLTATDWKTGQPRLFTYQPGGGTRPGWTPLGRANAHAAVLASAAIPGIFPAVHVEEAAHVDGGVVMNTPLSPAIDAQANVIHLVCLNPDVREIRLEGPANTLDVLERTLVAVVASGIRQDLNMAAFINSVAGAARAKGGDLYRKLTIHRYHPSTRNLGGIAGMLDFSLPHIEALIEEGRGHAATHDCERQGCILAGRPAGKAKAASGS